MSTIVDLTNQEITEIKQITKLDSDADAISQAVRAFLRLSRLRELKAVSGKVEYDDKWQELEALELGETGFPL